MTRGWSLDDAELREILRRIQKEVDGPIIPEYIVRIDSLGFGLFISRFGSLAQACLEAGCEYHVEEPDPEVYAVDVEDAEQRERLIGDLVRVVTVMGNRPTVGNIHSFGRGRYHKTISSFGSWPAVVLEAGLDVTKVPEYVSTEAIKEDLHRLTDLVGAPPSYDFASEHGEFSTIYDSRFPSWEVALQSANLDPDQINRRLELITELESLASDLGHRPNIAEIRMYTEFQPQVLRREFGSVENALDAADIPAERDLTPSGSLTESADGRAEIPSHTDLLRDIFTIKRRYSGDLKTYQERQKAFADRGIISRKHYTFQFGSVSEAFEFADQLDPRDYRQPREQRISDVPPEILSEHAWELAEILNRRPLIDEVVTLTDHTLEQYFDSFESWEAVFDLDLVGPDHGDLIVKLPTNLELLEDLELVGAHYGRPPTPEDFRDAGSYPVESVLRRFGSWPAALRAIGVQIDEEIPEEYLALDLTRETVKRANVLCDERFDHQAVLVDDLYRLEFDLRREPNRADIEKFSVYSVDAFEETFGNVSSIIDAELSEATTDGLEQGSNRSQLELDLETIAEIVDGRVWPHHIAFYGRYTLPSYLTDFGTLDEAFAAAGIDSDHFPQTVNDWSTAWDQDFVDAKAFLEAIRTQYEKTGTSPTMSEMYENGIYSQQCYRYYDSWNDALGLAGIPPNQRKARQSAPKAELLKAIRELRDELGRIPRTTDVERHGKYGISTYYNHYSTWESALEDAGLFERTAPPTDSGDSETREENTDSGRGSGVVSRIMDDFEKTVGENN